MGNFTFLRSVGLNLQPSVTLNHETIAVTSRAISDRR